MNALFTFLKSHWRPALGLVLIVGAFLGGRYSRPGKTVTQETSSDKLAVKTKETEKKVDASTKDEKLAVKTHSVTTTVAKPDGTVTTTAVVDTGIDRTTHEAEIKTVDRFVDRTVYQERTTTKTVTVTDRSRFMIGPTVGLNPLAIGQQGNLEVGLHAQARVWGPLFIGGYGRVNPSTGFKDLHVGVSAAFEF